MKNIFGTEETSTNIETPTIEDTYKRELERKLKFDIEEMGYSVKKVETNLELEKGIITKVILSINKSKKNENKDISINKVEVRKCKRRKHIK